MLSLAIDSDHLPSFPSVHGLAECAKLNWAIVEATVEAGGGSGEVTRLLRSWADGDTGSLNAVIPIVYDELRRIASREMKRGAPGVHLQTTVLVHEAYEKLVSASRPNLRDRRHFFAVAARAIRQIVIDTYRSTMAAKRGAGLEINLELRTGDLPVNDSPERVLQLSQAIDRLSSENAELAEILELSCFGGLSNHEIAELHATTLRTVQRKLLRAKAWVHHLLGE